MIDIHSHILPGIDDGAQDLDEAVKMARDAASDGIDIVVATPHIRDGIEARDSTKRQEAISILNRRLAAEGIPLDILDGAEAFIDLDLPERVRDGSIPTLGKTGKYVLIELPFLEIPPYAGEVVFRVLSYGFIPIIAHPERNAQVARDPNEFYKLARQGAMGQANAGSLTGRFGPEARKTALRLLANNMVQVIGSDAHSPEGRPCRLQEAVRAAAEVVGEDLARKMVTTVPELILAGREIEWEEPRPFELRRRRFFIFG